jgi:hypothetical protein
MPYAYFAAWAKLSVATAMDSSRRSLPWAFIFPLRNLRFSCETTSGERYFASCRSCFEGKMLPYANATGARVRMATTVTRTMCGDLRRLVS